MPRSTEPAAQSTSPISIAVSAPSRAIISEPAMAAPANSTIGRPDRMPIWVSDRCRSSWISGMTGGTARMVRRSATPASQSSSRARSGEIMMQLGAAARTTTAQIASRVKPATMKKIARGEPWSSRAPNSERR